MRTLILAGVMLVLCSSTVLLCYFITRKQDQVADGFVTPLSEQSVENSREYIQRRFDKWHLEVVANLRRKGFLETDFRGNNEYRLEDGPDRLTRIRPECFIDDYIGGWGFVRREVRSAKPFGNDDIFKEIVDFVNELDRLMYGLSPCIGHAFFGAYAHGLTRGPIYDFMKGQYKDEVPGSFDGITFFPAFSPFTNEYYPLDISASVRANYLEKEKLWILRLNCKFEVSFARKDRMQAIVD